MAITSAAVRISFLIPYVHLVISAKECLNRFNHYTLAFQAAENRALHGYVYSRMNVSSRVRCARECTMDRRCMSFNFYDDKQLCEINSVTYTKCAHLSQTIGSVYFDRNKDTPLLSLPDNTPIQDRASCKTLLNAGYTASGVYTIYPGGNSDGCMRVFCDMTLDGGGWTVFLRRQDGSVDFHRNWADYQAGFGDLSGEFWLGNDNLVTLTSDKSSGSWELQVDLEDWDNNTAWARYGYFELTGERYNLNFGNYDAASTAGNPLIRNIGDPFSTKDRDNDGSPEHCAKGREAGWWYGWCSYSQLTGKYSKIQSTRHGGIMWAGWKGLDYSLRKATMKIREMSLN